MFSPEGSTDFVRQGTIVVFIQENFSILSSKEKRTGKSKYSTSANGQGNGHSNTNGYINGNTANFRHNRRTSPRAKHTKTKTKSQQKNKTWVKPGQGFSDAGIGIKDINAARGMYNDVNIAGYY